MFGSGFCYLSTDLLRTGGRLLNLDVKISGLANVAFFLEGISDECISLLIYSSIEFRKQPETAGCKRLMGTTKESSLILLDFSFSFIIGILLTGVLQESNDKL